MQDNLNQLEEEFLKVNKVVGVSALVCIISSILVFFNVVFLLVTIISLIIYFKNYKKLNNLKVAKENVKNTNNIEELESKDIVVEEHLNEEVNEEDDILNERFLESTELYLKAFNGFCSKSAKIFFAQAFAIWCAACALGGTNLPFGCINAAQSPMAKILSSTVV